MSKIRIAIMGRMCSGKTTLAKYLVEQFGFKKYSFADPVKQVASSLFGMTTKDRLLLQLIGEKMKEIRRTVWAGKTINNIIEDKAEKVVIDDLRFLCECEILKENNFKIIKLEIDDKEQLKRICKTYPDTYLSHIEGMGHCSEKELETIDYDLVIKNDYLDKTYEKVRKFIS